MNAHVHIGLGYMLGNDLSPTFGIEFQPAQYPHVLHQFVEFIADRPAAALAVIVSTFLAHCWPTMAQSLMSVAVKVFVQPEKPLARLCP